MKVSRKFNIQNLLTLMFFIALVFNKQININSHELGSKNSIANLNLSKFNKANFQHNNLHAFPIECTYYDLKTNLILTEYTRKVHNLVNEIFLKNPGMKKNDIKFSQFFEIFQNGNYGKIAPELSESEDYVKSYFNYFRNPETFKMTIFEFTQFMGLYYLEGELLVENNHPYLSHFYPNEHMVNDLFGCKIAIAYWKIVNRFLKNTYINFNFNDKTSIGKKEIFRILITTITGRCWLLADKMCRFFEDFVTKAYGFFTMKSGKKKGLSVFETKILYSTFLFRDISVNTCDTNTFNPEVIQSKYQPFLTYQFK